MGERVPHEIVVACVVAFERTSRTVTVFRQWIVFYGLGIVNDSAEAVDASGKMFEAGAIRLVHSIQYVEEGGSSASAIMPVVFVGEIATAARGSERWRVLELCRLVVEIVVM